MKWIQSGGGAETWLGLQPRVELAQLPADSATPEARGTEFVPVEGGRDSTSAESLLLVAYCVLWVVLFWFVFSTWKRQGQLETRLADLDRRLARGPDDAPKS